MQPHISPIPPASGLSTLAAALAADDNQNFAFLRDVFRPTGGLARAHELAGMLRHPHPDGLRVLARWIAAREVVYVQCGGDYWLPLFQFDGVGELAPRACVRRVLAQLGPVFDPWDIALWFARPNPWLGGEVPSRKLDDLPMRVEQAARADRFAVSG